ncbi:MAG: LysM peptidoglycan-binding domain-containing protein [Opitutaceae bacterium]
MTVRRYIFALIALAALLGGVAGCSDRGSVPTLVETDEPFFVQGMQLKKQGRHAEALTAFLKVIDKRGTRAASESHLEAGAIFLNHTKDPLEACHHFRKYLELQPNSKEAEGVRGQVKIAMRDFASKLPGRPMEDQSVRLQAEEDIAKLRRENEELRAEIATLRGGGAMPVSRLPRMIAVPDEVHTTRAAPDPTMVVDMPARESPPAVSAFAEHKVAPATPSTKAAKAPTTAKSPPLTGRTHTVKPKESLYGIAKQYGVTVPELSAANGIKNPSSVAIGTVLKIPSPSR